MWLTLVIYLVRLFRSKGKKSFLKTDHILNGDIRNKIKRVLKQKGYKQIQKVPELWKKDILATKYYIEIKDEGDNTKISFWWKTRALGDYKYPLSFNSQIGPHGRLIRHYKIIKKVIKEK